jgi:hypothetical protein
MIRFSNYLRSAETPDDYRVEHIFIVAAQELNAPFGGVMQKTPNSVLLSVPPNAQFFVASGVTISPRCLPLLS